MGSLVNPLEKNGYSFLEGAAVSDSVSNPVFQSAVATGDVTGELACSPRRQNASASTKTTSAHRADDGQKTLDQSSFPRHYHHDSRVDREKRSFLWIVLFCQTAIDFLRILEQLK